MAVGEILAELSQIRQKSPGFLDAYLFEAEILRQRFHSSRESGDIARAFELVDAARKLAPGSMRPLRSWFEVALAAGELELAERALSDLEGRDPGNVWTVMFRAELADHRGDSRQAIIAMREAAERRPSWRVLFNLARVERRAGQIAEARRHLEELLRISPKNHAGLSLLAQLEQVSGSAERAVALYLELVALSPSYAGYSNLGTAQLLVGEVDDAVASFEKAAEMAPKNPLALFNLADAKQLSGDASGARALYEQVVALIPASPDRVAAGQLGVRAAALANLKDEPEALADIQAALQRAPESSDVAYQAAAVYAILGYDKYGELAKLNGKRALELGYEPRWFDFPWFDELRRDRAFAELLRRE